MGAAAVGAAAGAYGYYGGYNNRCYQDAYGNPFARNTLLTRTRFMRAATEQGLQTPLPLRGGCKPNLAWNNLLEDCV